MSAVINKEPKLPKLAHAGAFFGGLSLIMMFGSVGVLYFTEPKSPDIFLESNGILFMVCGLSGFILLYPAASLCTFATNPEEFLKGKANKAYIPLNILLLIFVVYLMPIGIESIIYEGRKRGTMRPPEEALLLLNRFWEVSWILMVSICLSLLCLAIISYCKRKVLPKEK